MTVLDDMMQLKYGSMDTWTSGLRVVTAATLETWDGNLWEEAFKEARALFSVQNLHLFNCSTARGCLILEELALKLSN